MARKALVLDSGDDLTKLVVEALADNGYTIHLISNEYRGKEFIKYPVYIHTIKSETYEALVDRIGLEDVETALFISPNDSLNMSLAKLCRSRGVPRVIVTLRNQAAEEEAEKYGIVTVNVSQCILGRLYRLLNLKYTRITPLRGDFGLLEMFVTADSRPLGRSLAEIEESYGVKAALIRNDEIITSPDAVAQEGDYLMAMGSLEALRDLSS
ncbi:MAG: TrkA family potassium uptake protein [Thermoproteus sp.]